MLLFLLNFMLNSFASEQCDLENLSMPYLEYKVYSCDKYFLEYAKDAVDFWKKIGLNVTFVEEVNNCKNMKSAGGIYIRFNDEIPKTLDTAERVTYGLSSRYISYETNSVIFTTVNIVSYDFKGDMQKLITHEVGHGLGFDHVNESCLGHIMHPILSKSGLSFY